MGDGNGWVRCALGHQHWGRFGAAGILVTDGDSVLLQHRAVWTHEGGSWAVPGGARDSHETPTDAALREATEETSLDTRDLDLVGDWVEDHGGWSYTTIIATTTNTRDVHPANAESTAVSWWSIAEVETLVLHRGFAAAWPRLREAIAGSPGIGGSAAPRSSVPAVHLLLPPSEAKTSGGRSRPMRHRIDTVGDNAGESLRAARATVVGALSALVDAGQVEAVRALALPAGVVQAALQANATVLDTATTPALRRYRGIVYEGFAFGSLSAREQRCAASSTLIFSGLWGVVRGDEPVPDYRVPAKADLPGIGIVSTFWRPVLAEVIPTLVRRGLILDLRSGDYAAMWRPDRDVARRVVVVRILSPAPHGGHAVISHTSKLAKGRLAAELVRRCTRGAPVDEVDDVVAAWADCGGVASKIGSATGHGSPAHLELYTG